MNIEIINPLEYPGWDQLLLTHKDYTFFHSSSWSRVLHESYNYRPLYFTSINNGKLTALVPMMEINSIITGKRGVSLPFSDYCQPIVESKMHFQEILNNIIIHGNKSGWKYFECRGGKRYLNNNINSLYLFTHEIDLTVGGELILSQLRNSTKRNIKKAIKNGVEIGFYQSLESVKEFCKLNFMTRKHHGIPPQPPIFFRKIYEHIISKNLGCVALASYQNKRIAGAIYFHIGDKAIYKFGAFNRKYQELRPNNLIIWSAIKWYSQNNYNSLSFGITNPENTGLRQFKLGWRVNETIINYYKFDLISMSFIKDKFRTKVSYNLFKKLPSPVLNLTGLLLYKHMG